MTGRGGFSRLIPRVAVLVVLSLGSAEAAAERPAPMTAAQRLVPTAAAERPVAVALPRLPAPLGLSFGMRPEQVPLPVVVPPPPLGVVAPPRAPVTSPASETSPRAGASRYPPAAAPRAAPTALFSSATPAAMPVAAKPAPVRPAGEPVAQRMSMDRMAGGDGLGDYLRACEAAFDSVSALAAGDRDWLAWRARHLRGGEGGDFADDLADRAGLAVAPTPAAARQVAGWRSAGLYRFDGADGRRVVCLLFTADGLAQVFLAGPALDGLRDEVIARLEDQRRLESFHLTREARRFSLSLRRPACGLYCRLFGERLLVERGLWLDPRTRILVAAKRGVVVSGFTGLFAGGGQSEVFDGIADSFLVSIDLGRRAFVPRQPPASGWATRPAAAQAFVPPPAGTSRKALVESFVP